MKTKKATSRNADRKNRYKNMATTGSRNETALDGPLTGHFETVIDEVRFGDKRPHEVLVQDGKRAAPKPETKAEDAEEK
jgi:hypothetical protein